MIFKIPVILTLIFISLKNVSGASYSKVFVQNGAEIVPVEFVKYGSPPLSITGSQLAQISAAPVGSALPLPAASNYLPPCAAPCVYPGSSIAAIQPATPNYVTYKSSVPVVVASNDDQSGYQYSYIVYDETTGDHKSQREHSDGSVVRGEYSLIQPDGYIREVQYVADDLQGFNAIVKNFLPVNVEKKVDHKEKKDPGPPCHEVKKEPLTHGHNEESSEESKEKSHEEIEKSSEEHSHEKQSADLKAINHHEEKNEEVHEEDTHKGHAEPVSSEAHSAEPVHEEHKIEHSDETKESHEEHKENSSESHEEASHEGHKENHDEHMESAHDARSHQENDVNALVSYNDIIKCVQSAIRKKNGVASPHQLESPLTYIILNKPC